MFTYVAQCLLERYSLSELILLCLYIPLFRIPSSVHEIRFGCFSSYSPPPPTPGNHVFKILFSMNSTCNFFQVPHAIDSMKDSFPLPGLLHLTQCSPGPPMSLQVAIFPLLQAEKCFILPAYYPFIHSGTCRLFSCLGHCESYHNEHGIQTSLEIIILRHSSRSLNCQITWQFYFFF